MFSPDDLDLVKGGPSGRRDFLDDLLSGLAPRYEAARGDFERVLRHRNALLRAGIRDPDDRSTLDVFDEQLVQSGAELVRGRLRLIERLVPVLATSYTQLAGRELHDQHATTKRNGRAKSSPTSARMRSSTSCAPRSRTAANVRSTAG